MPPTRKNSFGTEGMPLWPVNGCGRTSRGGLGGVIPQPPPWPALREDSTGGLGGGIQAPLPFQNAWDGYLWTLWFVEQVGQDRTFFSLTPRGMTSSDQIIPGEYHYYISIHIITGIIICCYCMFFCIIIFGGVSGILRSPKISGGATCRNLVVPDQ